MIPSRFSCPTLHSTRWSLLQYFYRFSGTTFTIWKKTSSIFKVPKMKTYSADLGMRLSALEKYVANLWNTPTRELSILKIRNLTQYSGNDQTTEANKMASTVEIFFRINLHLKFLMMYAPYRSLLQGYSTFDVSVTYGFCTKYRIHRSWMRKEIIRVQI